VRVTEQGEGRLALSLTGPVAPLLRVVADLDPTDLVARPADLDELFLSYYRAGDAGGSHA
jgi:ABC-2 type transport system ATP-binding protein